MNETGQNESTTSGESDNNTLKSSLLSKEKEREKMDRENVYHWRATREIMALFRRPNIIPETRRLVEQQDSLYRQRTLRRRLSYHRERHLHNPAGTNGAEKKIAANDAELIRRANRIGSSYQPIVVEEEEEPEKIREE